MDVEQFKDSLEELLAAAAMGEADVGPEWEGADVERLPSGFLVSFTDGSVHRVLTETDE